MFFAVIDRYRGRCICSGPKFSSAGGTNLQPGIGASAHSSDVTKLHFDGR